MRLLSIDTSTSTLSLAVSQGERVLKFRNQKLARPLSASIMAAIRRIITESGLSLTELDAFAVGLGPGSFTSLRVGLATVKGLAFATGKPVVGIPSLDILAANVREDRAVVCAICDARRNLVYACLYEKRGETLGRKSDYLLTGIKELLGQMDGKIIFAGNGISLLKDEIGGFKGITPEYLDGKNMFPQARLMPALAMPRLRAGQSDDIDRLVPLYLYPDHCQIKKKETHKGH